MKKIVPVLLLLIIISFFSCKKAIQQQEQNEALNIMTNGQWLVSKYLQDSTDITSTLSAYVFQFKSDGTVTGTYGTITVTGTWSTDIPSRTITSNFPAGSGAVNELDATWKITDSSTDYVIAYSTINSNTNNLKLVKK
jgi:hypothetical protein